MGVLGREWWWGREIFQKEMIRNLIWHVDSDGRWVIVSDVFGSIREVRSNSPACFVFERGRAEGVRSTMQRQVQAVCKTWGYKRGNLVYSCGQYDKTCEETLASIRVCIAAQSLSCAPSARFKLELHIRRLICALEAGYFILICMP